MKKLAILLIVLMIFSVGFLSGCSEQNTDNENKSSTETYTSPAITSFYVSPESIDEGDTSKLYWIVSNAESVEIDNGIGYVSLTGNRGVSPTNTTTYTLTARNGDKTSIATVHLVVVPIDYSMLLIGTWDLVLAIRPGAFERWIFKSDKTCEFQYILYDQDGPFTLTYHESWYVKDNILTTFGGDFAEGYSYYWTLSYDGTYLTMLVKPPPGYAGDGKYKKVS